MDYTSLLSFLQLHGYWILFPLVMVEGPIAVTAAAFAASFKVMNVYLVFVISFLAFTVGDLVLYSLGRFGRESIVNKHFGKIMKSKNMIKVKKLLEKYYFRAIILIKIVPPLPIPGLIFAGADELKFRRFIFASVIVNLVSCVAFVLLGYYFGKFVERISLGSIQLVFASLLLSGVLIFAYKKNSSKIYRKIHGIN